ncbi:MAG: acyltransferase domain-containing protein [Bacteroidota bacterium]|nr:acyltransferase domain-containing protein [Bacteroidota bacterium]
MNSTNKITGLFIGNEQIVLDCANIFKKSGGEIVAISGCNKRIEQWADDSSITFIREDNKLSEKLKDYQFDYLFSITNIIDIAFKLRVLPAKASVHLHSGILPNYAGSNISFWVLNNNEREHGITWQIISKKIEDEYILKQSIFPIKSSDTAGTLLEKCYAEAKVTFDSLINDIINGSLTYTRQDLGKRVFVSGYQKPLLAGVINWEDSAEKIVRLINSLDHGKYPNRIAAPKLKIEDDFFIVKKIGFTSQTSELHGGTVINADDSGILVTTKTNNVIIKQVSDLFGNIVPIKEMVRKYGIVHGFKFQYISKHFISSLLEFDFSINKNEGYWINQLSNVDCSECSEKYYNDKQYSYNTIALSFDDKTISSFYHITNLFQNSMVRALFVLFMLQKCNKQKMSIGLYDTKLTKILNSTGMLFSQIVPVNIMLKSNNILKDTIYNINNSIEHALTKKTFYNDVFARYPEIKELTSEYLYPVVIAQIDDIKCFEEIEGPLITLIITKDNKYYLNYNSALHDEKDMKKQIKEFYQFIDSTMDGISGKNDTEKNITLGGIISDRTDVDIISSDEPACPEKMNVVTMPKKVVFMFPGEGVQFPNMARGLYEKEPIFKSEVDNCFNILESKFNISIKAFIYPEAKTQHKKTRTFESPLESILSVFIIEYSLARFWISLGVNPSAMIGQSLGEYVAACLSGVFSIEDSFKLLIAQNKILSRMPKGAMLSISKSESEIAEYLGKDLSLAAVNAANLCVLSGSQDAIDSLQDACRIKDIEAVRIKFNLPEHSHLLEPLLSDYKYDIRDIVHNKPNIPFISSVTGCLIKDSEALSCDYWVTHFVKTMRFEKGIKSLLNDKDNIFLEIGPGRSLNFLLSLQSSNELRAYPSLKYAKEKISDISAINRAIFFLEINNVKLDFFNYQSKDSYFKDKEEKSNRLFPDSDGKSKAIVLNETQTFIADLWQEMLNIDHINIHDDFINLGGHSLLLIRSINTINHYFNIELPLNKVFKEPTIKNVEFLIYEIKNKDTSEKMSITPAQRNLFKSKLYLIN